MAIRIADIFANLSVRSEDYDRGLSAAQGKATAFGGVMQGILQGVGQRLFDGIVTGAQKFIGAMGDAVQASSNLHESINKTGVIFGDSAQEILKWSETSDKAFGLSQQGALEAAGSFGALFRQMGQTSQQSAKISENLVQIAADLGSIYNVDPSIALDKLQSGLTGASRPLRDLNIFLSENAVNQKAVQLGLAASTDAVGDQAKVMARYAIIVDQSKIAQGDFARTSHNLANEQRILAAEVENGSAKLGNVFRPAIEAITNSLIDVAPTMFGYGENILDQLANGLAAGIRAIMPVIQTVRQLFTYWFAPGSPPRVLPDIDKWGAAAMGQFLSGFSSVDVKAAFDTVGSAIETILRSSVTAGKSSESGLVSSIFGTRTAIQKAVAEFASAGSVSESTINKIVRAAGGAGKGIGDLVKSYFDLQKATEATTRAQDSLNRITDQYDAILDPLRGKLDDVKAQQQSLANQQRLIADQNTLNNFDSTAAEKQAASLDIQQIALENQIATTEKQKQVATDAAQANVDGAKKEQDAAQKKMDAAQATIDQQVQTNNLIGEQSALEKRLADERDAEAKKQQQLADQLHQAQLQYLLGTENTQQKIATLRGELANTTTGSVEYLSILGQINSLEKQAADDAKRDSDKVTDAQFQYNLELADTAGKIALWQEKLAGVTKGSADYYDILSKIHALQEQKAKQDAKGGEDDIGAGLTAGALPDLSGLTGGGPGGKNLADALTEAFAPIGPASENIKALSDSLKAMVEAFGKIFGIDVTPFFAKQKEAVQVGVKSYGEFGAAAFGAAVDAGNAAEKQKKDAEDTAIAIKSSVDDMTLSFKLLQSDLKLIGDIMTGDWKQFWIDRAENTKLGNESVNKNQTEGQTGWTTSLDTWLADIEKRWNTFWTNVGTIIVQGGIDAGAAFANFTGSIITHTTQWFLDLGKAFSDGAGALPGFFLTSIVDAWVDVIAWWDGVLQGLRDYLPGSEPKNASSPLANLGDAGRALVNNIWDGIKEVWATFTAWWSTSLAAFVAFITDTTYLQTLYDGASGMLTSVWNGAQAVWTTISDWWSGKDGVLGSFVTVIGTYLESIKTAGGSLITNVLDGAKAIWTDVTAWWSGTGGVLDGFIQSVTGLGTRMYNAGKGLLTNLWDGLKEQVPSLPSWMQDALGPLVDQLPGSEPKDPSSPLANLKRRGAALVNNFQSGIQSASMNIQPLANNLLPAMSAPSGATSTTTNSVGQVTQNLHFYGPVDQKTVTKAAADGLDSVIKELRSSGVR